VWRQEAATVENVRSSPDGLIAEEGKTGSIVWTMKSPYGYRADDSKPKATVYGSSYVKRRSRGRK
jgi:hypothetical protein